MVKKPRSTNRLVKKYFACLHFLPLSVNHFSRRWPYLGKMDVTRPVYNKSLPQHRLAGNQTEKFVLMGSSADTMMCASAHPDARD